MINDCVFILSTIDDGAVPLQQVIEHITACSYCQQTLDWAFEEYKNYESLGRPTNHDGGCICSSLKWIPAGLSKDNFLQGWRTGSIRSDETYEFHCAEASEKMCSHKERELAKSLFNAIHLAIGLHQVGAPKQILKNCASVLLKHYSNFQKFLGPTLFASFMGFDTDNAEHELKKIMDFWEKFLVSDE